MCARQTNQRCSNGGIAAGRAGFSSLPLPAGLNRDRTGLQDFLILCFKSILSPLFFFNTLKSCTRNTSSLPSLLTYFTFPLAPRSRIPGVFPERRGRPEPRQTSACPSPAEPTGAEPSAAPLHAPGRWRGAGRVPEMPGR